MTSRERVIKALTFDNPDRAPRNLWAMPGVRKYRDEEYRSILDKWPDDFASPTFKYGQGRLARGERYEVGEYVDDWGSVWCAGEPGVVGEVKEYPLADWSALDSYEPPWELLDEADFSQVNGSCAESDRFMLAGPSVQPFERMQFLRGTENLFLDLAYGAPEIYRLRDMLHEFFVRELQAWLKTDIDGASFSDDWGTQIALLISPSQWREFFKPLYKDYCDTIHAAGKYAFFHSDGCIEAIYPDLIEIGVDAINSQLFCMDIEGLAAKYKGKITFWGEIDRQRILPFGTPDEVRAAVRRVRAALDDGAGGVVAQCDWGLKDSIENIDAMFDEWTK